MKTLVITAFLAALGFAAAPASSSAMPIAPDTTAESGLVQHVDAGCARGYYRSYGRCIPYSRGYRGPRYYYAPPYYVAPPTYYYRPYYRPYRYYRPRYYYRPYY